MLMSQWLLVFLCGCSAFPTNRTGSRHYYPAKNMSTDEVTYIYCWADARFNATAREIGTRRRVHDYAPITNHRSPVQVIWRDSRHEKVVCEGEMNLKSPCRPIKKTRSLMLSDLKMRKSEDDPEISFKDLKQCPPVPPYKPLGQIFTSFNHFTTRHEVILLIPFDEPSDRVIHEVSDDEYFLEQVRQHLSTVLEVPPTTIIADQFSNFAHFRAIVSIVVTLHGKDYKSFRRVYQSIRRLLSTGYFTFILEGKEHVVALSQKLGVYPTSEFEYLDMVAIHAMIILPVVLIVLILGSHFHNSASLKRFQKTRQKVRSSFKERSS